MNKLRFIAFIVILIAAAASLYISYRLVIHRTQTDLPVAVNSLAVASGPLFIATDPTTGIIKQSDFKYREIPFAAGRLALDALKGGDVDLATVAETPVVLASIDRPDLRIVATFTKSQFRVVARRSKGVSSIADLKGKRVAYLAGSSSEYFLWRLLQNAGLSTSDVTLINLQPPDMVAALRRADVDAISIWEPHAQRAKDAVGAADSIVFDSQGLYTEYFNIVTTTEVLRDRHKRAAIVELLTALQRANETIYKDPTKAREIIGNRISMASSELEAIWNRFDFAVTLDVDDLVLTMQDIERWDSESDKRPPRSTGDLQRLINDSLIADIK